MSIIQIKDADHLLAKAREVHRPIQISTFYTVRPDEHNVRRPGLLLQYSLQLNDDDEETLTWTLIEIAFADKKGSVDLSGTLLHRLQLQQAGAEPVAFEVSRWRRAM
ncbi:MAG TPA: hypothetical protein VNO30_33670 [Kofleriaceae bacterium]|nr:hypothetical protein [Kofleriaceae bacterium]